MLDESSSVLPSDTYLYRKGIRRIAVDGLFGEYTYDLTARVNKDLSSPKFLLLYGDNGSGKTTLLNIIFYLLSNLDKVGHKTKVKRYPFKSVVIEFADGTMITASREEAQNGPYKFSISKSGSAVAETIYGQSHEGASAREKLLKEAQHDKEHAVIIALLESLAIRLVFLRHTRKIVTNVRQAGPKDAAYVKSIHSSAFNDDDDDEVQGLNLQSTVYMLNRWVTEQALRGANQGEEDVNELFSEIISTLAHSRTGTGTEPVGRVALDALVEELVRERDKYLSFSEFGLVRPLKLEPLLTALAGLPAHAYHSVIQVLSPYVRSLGARLDALESVRNRFATFVDLVNSFYRNKTIRLDVYRGLKIKTRLGEPLGIQKLSSGESQLLYLLANVLVIKDKSTIFIVDEPEISLNVKWQRQLVRSLLDLTNGSDIQFIFATHSIELLSRYREFVALLDDVE